MKIYCPATAEGELPIIIFSHGLGGSREGYGYLGKFWAENGFVSVHLTHHGSDGEALLKTGHSAAARQAGESPIDPKRAIDRCKDVGFCH